MSKALSINPREQVVATIAAGAYCRAATVRSEVSASAANTGLVAPMVLDGPINSRAFLAYVDEVLVPELKPGYVVVMDNLGSHKSVGIRASVEAVGARLLFLPPYNPIENAFPELKALLRKPAERTNHFAEAGDDPERSEKAPALKANAPGVMAPRRNHSPAFRGGLEKEDDGVGGAASDAGRENSFSRPVATPQAGTGNRSSSLSSVTG